MVEGSWRVSIKTFNLIYSMNSQEVSFKPAEIVAVITDALFVKKLKFILYSMTKRNMCKGKGYYLDNDFISSVCFAWQIFVVPT